MEARNKKASDMSELLTQNDPLTDFERREYTCQGATRAVYVAGQGPGVVLLSEMPGISPHLARFARWLRDAGFTVFMPSLFGEDGAVPRVEEGIKVFRRTCISAEFRALEAGGETPIVTWLRELARIAHQDCRVAVWCHRHVLHRELRAEFVD